MLTTCALGRSRSAAFYFFYHSLDYPVPNRLDGVTRHVGPWAHGLTLAHEPRSPRGAVCVAVRINAVFP
eukprot:4169478-Prymnesium_polylepis.1